MPYRCEHDPKTQSYAPIGMYHCPECGVMVLAGLPHPDIKRFAPRTKREDPIVDISDKPELWSDDDDFDYDIDWSMFAPPEGMAGETIKGIDGDEFDF